MVDTVKSVSLFVLSVLVVSVAFAATFSDLKVHLDEHNSDILFEGDQDFEEFRLYDGAVEIDGRNVSVRSDNPDLIETNISRYEPVGDDEILELDTSTAENAEVTFEFDGPDGEYTIQRNGEFFDQQTVSGELSWSHDSWNEDHSFTVLEEADREVWVESVQPNDTNVDPESVELQATGYSMVTNQVTVEFYQEDGTLIESMDIENGTTATTQPDLETQSEYQWYIEVTDGEITEQTEVFNFTTIDLDFSWTDTSDNEDGFLIETNHTTQDDNSFEEIQELPEETEQTRVTHPTLQFSEEVCLRVKAFNIGGVSGPAENCIQTPDQPDNQPWS